MADLENLNKSDGYRIILMLAGTAMELPVLPERISVKQSFDSSEKKVLGLGAVNLLNGAKLRQISFGSFFPAQKIPSVKLPRSRLREPMYYVRKLRECMESKEPLRFILLGADIDVNTRMSVESFEYSESYGEVGSLEYTLTLKEWVDYSPRRVTIKENIAAAGEAERSGTPAGAPEDRAVSYTVKAGDCLWAICKASYDDGSLYDKLYSANKTVIDRHNSGTGNPKYTIYVGEILNLPPKEEL